MHFPATVAYIYLFKQVVVKKHLLQLLKIILPVGLGVYLVIHIYNQLDATQRAALFDAFKGANYFWVALSFCLGLLSHFIRGYRWKFQLEAMGYEVPVATNFMAVMSGYIVNMILPRVGEATRALVIQRYNKVPFQKGFGSIMAERALDFIILIAICTATLVMQYSALKKYADALEGTVINKLLSPVFWIVLGLLFILATLLLKWLRSKRENRLFGWIFNFIDGLIEGIRSVVRMKNRGAYILATLAIWALYIAMFWVCFYSLQQTAHLGIDAVSAGFVVGSFAIVLIPGGIGAFPVGIMEVLSLYGVAEETGFALGWILWFSQTTMIVFVGGLSLILLPIIHKPKKKSHDKP
jgi:uncharacterized protein (TIRG00374 family)